MNPAWRVLLWILVVIAPGGVLLLPILAAEAMRRRAALAGAAERVSRAFERPALVAVGPSAVRLEE